MFRSPGRAKVGFVGVLGVIGELNVPIVIEGLDISVISSGLGAPGRAGSLSFISLFVITSPLVVLVQAVLLVGDIVVEGFVVC